MKNSGYDELQVATRHRIAFHALILTFIVIMVNAWVKKTYGAIWPDPMLESLGTIFIPATYFTVMAILKNAYLRAKDYPALFIIAIALAFLLSSASFITITLSGLPMIIENGQLSNRLGSLLITIYTGCITVALLIRYIRNKRIDDES